MQWECQFLHSSSWEKTTTLRQAQSNDEQSIHSLIRCLRHVLRTEKNTSKRDLHYFGRVCHAMCDNKKERAVIVFTVTQQKIKLETVQKKLPEEEAKKMKCCKRLIYKQFFQVSGLYVP